MSNKSLKSRLNGKSEEAEFLELVGKGLGFKAMDKFGFSTYTSVRNLVKELTGDENYGLNTKYDSYHKGGFKGIFEVFFTVLADKLVRYEQKIAELERELEARRSFDEKTEMDIAGRIIEVTQMLKARGV